MRPKRAILMQWYFTQELVTFGQEMQLLYACGPSEIKLENISPYSSLLNHSSSSVNSSNCTKQPETRG